MWRMTNFREKNRNSTSTNRSIGFPTFKNLGLVSIIFQNWKPSILKNRREIFNFQNFCSYGDIYPTTIAGKILASAVSVVGIILLAFPISVIAENFNEEYVNKGPGQTPGTDPVNFRFTRCFS